MSTDIAALHAAGALDTKPNVQSSQAHGMMENGGGHKMLGFEGHDIGSACSTSGISNIIPTGEGINPLGPMTQGGGALGQSVTEFAGKMVNYLGAEEAKGDNIALSLGHAELSQAKAPTFASEAQFKKMGMIGAEGQGH